MTRAEFEKLVDEEFARLPPHIVAKLRNVGFVLEQEPTDEQRELGAEAHLDEPCGDPECEECAEPGDLLGLYEGLPLNERGAGDMALPDKITLFQGPLERLAGDDLQFLRDEIYETLLHEIGHHFGFCEDDVLRLEDKRAEQKTAGQDGDAVQ